MQEGRTEQNERRTLQREFDVRSLEKGEHTPQHLFDSLRKNSLSRNVRASRRSHHPPNGGSLSASEGGCEGDRVDGRARNGMPLASDGAAVLAGTSHQPPFIESDDGLAGCNYQTEEHCRI